MEKLQFFVRYAIKSLNIEFRKRNASICDVNLIVGFKANKSTFKLLLQPLLWAMLLKIITMSELRGNIVRLIRYMKQLLSSDWLK